MSAGYSYSGEVVMNILPGSRHGEGEEDRG